MKDKTRTIIYVTIVFIIILSVCGVKYGVKYYYLHKNDKEITFAAAAAEQYISEKYGFKAESFEQNDDALYPTWFNDDDYMVSFKARHDGRDFHVVYEKYGDQTVCSDDYQWEEIYSAAEKYACESFPKGKVIKMRLSLSSSYFYYLMDKDSFFNGENITDILKKSSGQLKMVFYDTKFSQSEIEKVFPTDRFAVEFASFDTWEHLDEYYNSKNGYNSYSDFYRGLEKYAPYITDYIKSDNDGVSGYDITILENNEFRYAYFPVEPRKLVTRTNITAESVEKSTLTEIFTSYGEERWLDKPISKEYYFDSGYGDVWVYYPLKKLEGYDLENVGLAWFSSGGMSNNHNIEKAQICGDYAVFNMPFGEDYFMLVVTSGLEEYVPNYD